MLWTGLQNAVCNRTMQYALYLIFSHWIWLTCSIKINRIPQREICQAYEKVFFSLFVFSRQETDLNSAYFSLFPTANFSSPSLVVSQKGVSKHLYWWNVKLKLIYPKKPFNRSVILNGYYPISNQSLIHSSYGVARHKIKSRFK